MFFVHLLVDFARVNLYPFSLPIGVREWLRLVIVALPGGFLSSFLMLEAQRAGLWLVGLLKSDYLFQIQRQRPEMISTELTGKSINLYRALTSRKSNARLLSSTDRFFSVLQTIASCCKTE